MIITADQEDWQCSKMLISLHLEAEGDFLLLVVQ